MPPTEISGREAVASSGPGSYGHVDPNSTTTDVTNSSPTEGSGFVADSSGEESIKKRRERWSR